MRFIGLLLVIAAVVLAVLNPGMEEFEDFASKHAGEVIKREMGDSALGDIAAGAGAGIVERYMDRMAERENYLVASVYTIDLDGPKQDEEHWRFLGIGGRFLELERPPSLSENQ